MTVAVIFTSRLAVPHDEEYAELSARMGDLVDAQPGFISRISVRDPHTRVGITVAYFEDEASVRSWKRHPEHAEAQRRGWEDLYAEYHVTVAEVTRQYDGPRT